MLTRSAPLPPRPVRWAGTLLLAGVAALALGHHRAWRDGIASFRVAAVRAGIEGKELAGLEARFARESDLDEARLALADALFGRELDAPDPSLAASGERLAAARALAFESLTRLPASHEALMTAGAALAVLRARARDPRLFSLAREWEVPLERAIALAPGAVAPRRLLAAAYVDVWPVIAPAKRARIEPMLREAFLDPSTFERLFATWVEIAGSLDAAAALLPDLPRSWKRLAEAAFNKRDWAGYAAMRARHRAAIAAEFDRELAATQDRLARGDAASARNRLSQSIVVLPVDREFASRLEQALALRPGGPASDLLARAAVAWLAWTRPLCLVRGCPLSADAIGRLGSLAGARLPQEIAAFAALAGGDATRAALIERRSDTLWSEAWAPYLTYKAAWLAGRGETVEARLALRGAHRAFRSRLAWRRAAAELRLDTALPESPPVASQWEASDWWFDAGAARLDLLPAREAGALLLTFAAASREGALLEPLWDGAALAPVVVAPGATSLRLPVSVSREAHLLELGVRWGDLRPAARVTLE